MLSLHQKCESRPKRNAKSTLTGKTTVKIFTQDGIREILVPSQERLQNFVRIKPEEFERIQDQIRYKPQSDQSIKEKLAEESRIRKEKMQQIDAKTRTKSLKMSFLEEEAAKKAQYLLERAWQMRMEQEDEIKAANSLILKTKCQAIRDAQLREKVELKKKQEEEERRCLMIMEEELRKGLQEEKKLKDLEKQRNGLFIKELNEQVDDIRNQRQLEAELLLVERKRINEATYTMMNEELKKLNEAEQMKLRIRKELKQANEQLQRAKDIEKEEAIIADLKAQEWMRQRAMREEALEKEAEEARRKRELEINKLRKMQEKTTELQELQEHMAEVRRMEEYERNWRMKEAATAVAKKKMNEETLKARKQQIYDNRRVQAMEEAREKREFERIIAVQQAAEARDRKLEQQRKNAAAKFREGILRQMNEREAEAIASRRAELNEGIAIRAEEAKREADLKRVLKAKVDNLRGSGFPEIYVAEIARQFHVSQ